MPINCLLVDDHTLFREGIRHLLGVDPEIEVVAEANDASEALVKVREYRPDIVLMDIGMPGLSSFEAARLIEKTCPGTRIIFLTMYEDEEYLLQSLDAERGVHSERCSRTGVAGSGERGFARPKVSKPASLEKVLNPDKGQGPLTTRFDSLTPREREIVKMLAEGKSVRETAEFLSLSVKTVDAHKFNLMRKLQIHNTAQLVAYAIQRRSCICRLGHTFPPAAKLFVILRNSLET